MEPTLGASHPSCATGLLRRAVALLVALLSIGAGAPAVAPVVTALAPNAAAFDEVSLSVVAAPDQSDQSARRTVARRRRRLSWVTTSLSPRRFLQPPLTWFAGWSWRWEPTLLRQRRGPPLVTY